MRKLLALLVSCLSFAPASGATSQAAIPTMDRYQVRDADDDRAGIMEYFDWLAGCHDRELQAMSREYNIKCEVYEGPMTPQARHALGLQIWQAM